MKKIKAKVRFFGDDITFQFSKTGGGSVTRLSSVWIKKRLNKKECENLLRFILSKPRSKRNKTKIRFIPLCNSEFNIFIGYSYFRFKGEEPRWVKVWGEGLPKYGYPKRWESYDELLRKPKNIKK